MSLKIRTAAVGVEQNKKHEEIKKKLTEQIVDLELEFRAATELAMHFSLINRLSPFLNLYINRDTIKSISDSEIEPYGLANLILAAGQVEYLWESISEFIFDKKTGLELSTFDKNKLNFKIIYKAVFIFCEALVELDIPTLFKDYCSGFDANLGMNILNDVKAMASLEALVEADPIKGLGLLLGKVIEQTALAQVKR